MALRIIVSMAAPITLKSVGAFLASWVDASAASAPPPTSMEITKSAPMARTTSAGTLLSVPPSTSSWLPSATGGKMPGSDIVARIASERLPDPITTTSALRVSAATSRIGVGS